MAKYIELETLLKQIEDFPYMRTVLPIILKTIPLADAVEVKHGRWIVKYGSKKNVWCSVCNRTRDVYTQIGWHYCPNCGARMDGKTNGHD